MRIFLKTLARITKFKGFVGNGPRVGSVNEDKLIVNYKYVTQSPVRPQSIELLRRVPEYQKQRIHERRFVFDKILWIYRHLPQLAFVLALMFIPWRMVRIVRGSKVHAADVMSIALLAGIISYAMILTVVQVTSYSEIGRQLNTTYPIVLAFLLSTAWSAAASFRSQKPPNQGSS